MYKKTRREIPTACFLRYGGAVLFPVLLLVALILFLLIALVVLLVLILVLVVLTVIVVLHEMTSFRPIGYSHILDGAAGKYAFLSKKRKKLLTNTRAAGKLNQQNKEG